MDAQHPALSIAPPAAAAPYRHIAVEPVTAVIGAEIGGVDLAAGIAPEVAAEIRRALNSWRVVFFRDQAIDSAQLADFGRAFGALTEAHPLMDGVAGHPEVWERNDAHYRSLRIVDKVPNPLVGPKDDHNGWHLDTTFAVNPNAYSILYGVEIPDHGGDTMFTSLIAAYAGLSAPIRDLLDGLKAVHTLGGLKANASSPEVEGRPRGKLAALHPLVRVHPETGEKLLFLNPQLTSHIMDLSYRESHALLALLETELTRPEHSMRFRWRSGSIAMWDNRGVAHAGPVGYDFAGGPRIVHRVTVAGEVPVGADGFTSRSLRGDPLRSA